MEDLTGKQFGPYQIVAPLGKGGMATVYKAYQPGMERYVALKVLPRYFAHDNQLAGRFQQEAKVLAGLQHPHILPIFDFGEADDYTYIVMPLIKNGTLSDWLQGRPLPLPEIVRVISQVADALDYAHGQGLIHRDVKPSNILMDERGNCLLSDFGIVKLMEGSAHFTTTSSTVGTPKYMSPEQGLGEPLDRRSDVYALGVILYEMNTGRAPFDADTPMAMMYKHVNSSLPTPRLYNSDLPVAVEEVIQKALAKNPDDRYATTVELARALRAAMPEAASNGGLGNEVRALEFSPTMAMPPANGPIRAALPEIKRPRPKATPAQMLVVGGLVVGLGLLSWWVMSLQKNAPGQSPTPTAEVTAASPAATTGAVLATLTQPPTIAPTSIPPTLRPSLTLSPTPTASPTLGVGTVITSPVDGAEMVYVPAGDFLMGSDVKQDVSALPDEKPQHTVELNAFWIDRKEVTNAAYAMCVKAEKCHPPFNEYSATRSVYYTDTLFADFPVIFVSWYDARDYCTWAGRRLPTEAEWEKAARGTQGQIFPWGETSSAVSSLLNFDKRQGDTTVVGNYVFGASPYGALDMAGNVWEWVADTYRFDYYLKAPTANPPGPEVGSLKVYRGGAWDEVIWSVRAAARGYNNPRTGYPDVGFRCAADAP